MDPGEERDDVSETTYMLAELRRSTFVLERMATVVGGLTLLAVGCVVGGLILGADDVTDYKIWGRTLTGLGLGFAAFASILIWRREQRRSQAEVLHSELTIEYQRLARSKRLAESDWEEDDEVPIAIRVALRRFVAAGDLPFGEAGLGPIRYLALYLFLAALAVVQWPTFG